MGVFRLEAYATRTLCPLQVRGYRRAGEFTCTRLGEMIRGTAARAPKLLVSAGVKFLSDMMPLLNWVILLHLRPC